MKRKPVLIALAAIALVAVGWVFTQGDDGVVEAIATDASAPSAEPVSAPTEAVVEPADGSESDSATPTGADNATTSAPDVATATTVTEPPVLTTTTTVPPVDERLPRTEAEASESDPVPVGEVLEAAPGIWDIAVTGVDLDAAETVLGFADINPEPDAGFQYVLVTLEGTYLGEAVAQPVFEWAVIAGGTEYLPEIPGCGVIPNPIYDVVEVAPGDSFLAFVCAPVAGADIAAGAELYLNAPGDDPRYFALS